MSTQEKTTARAMPTKKTSTKTLSTTTRLLFVSNDGTTMVLSPDSDFFKFFRDQAGAPPAQ